jgi:DNA-binding MarR family transcriptional regulator
MRQDGTTIDIGALDGSISYFLRRAHISVSEKYSALFDRLDLRPYQFGVLVLVGQNEGVGISQAAGALDVQLTNFAVVIKELERRRLIRRRASTSDRRSQSLYLTSRGRALLESALQLQRQQEEQLSMQAGGLGPRALVAMLKALAK